MYSNDVWKTEKNGFFLDGDHHGDCLCKIYYPWLILKRNFIGKGRFLTKLWMYINMSYVKFLANLILFLGEIYVNLTHNISWRNVCESDTHYFLEKCLWIWHRISTSYFRFHCNYHMKFKLVNFFLRNFIDWLAFNAKFSRISAIFWCLEVYIIFCGHRVNSVYDFKLNINNFIFRRNGNLKILDS